MTQKTPKMYRSSSLMKMMEEAPENRQIKKFPVPYSLYHTPYLNTDFNEVTKRVCQENRAVISYLRICKVILLGDVCVGKTCIVNRFCHQIFDTCYKATIGVDFDVEKFQILGLPFTLQIWDTAGQERFKSIAQSYYRKAHVVVLVFDVTNISTLGNCKIWLKEALDVCEGIPLKFLVGTKKDLLSEASYKTVESYATQVAKSIDAEYWVCSSKKNENIENLFKRIASLAFDIVISNEFEEKTKNVEIGSTLISLKTLKSSTSKYKSHGNCGVKCYK